MAVLPTPGSPTQHGVVLGPARQDLDHPADLFVAADNGVELAAPGKVGKVPAVTGEGLVLVLGVLVGHALGAANVHEHGEDGVLGDPVAGQNIAGRTVDLGRGDEEVFGAEVLVLEPLSLLLCLLKELVQPGRDRSAQDLPPSGAYSGRHRHRP